MKYVNITKMQFVVLTLVGVFLISPILFAQSNPRGVPVGEEFCACPGIAKPLGNASSCEAACFGEPSSNPSIDYESQRRAQDEAAENQRKRENEQHLEKERQMEIKRKKDADFISDRDAAISTLKGSLGNTTSLKGLSGSQSSELKGIKPVLTRKLKENPSLDPVSVKKTIAALDCAVKSILEESKSVDTDSIQTDLNAVKNIIRTPPNGKKDTYQTQSISFNHQNSTNGKEKQIIGSISVSRNEETGEVHIDVMQATSTDTGFFKRIFGKKKSTQESQSLMIIDRNGVILDKEVPNSVKKCLNARKNL